VRDVVELDTVLAGEVVVRQQLPDAVRELVERWEDNLVGEVALVPALTTQRIVWSGITLRWGSVQRDHDGVVAEGRQQVVQRHAHHQIPLRTHENPHDRPLLAAVGGPSEVPAHRLR
jgi:hypothetical protein